jgi:hypothetical protein
VTDPALLARHARAPRSYRCAMSSRVSGRPAGEAGQSTVEWIGLIVIITVFILGVTAGVRSWLPGVRLAESIAMRILCAAGMSSKCAESGDLVAAYGPELAAAVERRAPEIVYEQGMKALPVDFRDCRNPRCANGPDSGAVWRSNAGQPAVAFVHAVDCRTELARMESASHGYDCAGDRTGNLYVQYWTYYVGSSFWGRRTHHDDWEGMQVRVSADGGESRATSHHGYNYTGGPLSWPSDAGVVHRSAWGSATGKLYVSGGSHAGRVYEHRRFSIGRAGRAGAAVALDAAAVVRHRRPRARMPRRLTVAPAKPRWTPASRLTLIPIETLDERARAIAFDGITPPWEKAVYSDPESQDT